MLAAPNVHQHGAFRHHGERSRAKDAFGFWRQRQQADRDIGLIEKRLKLIATMEDGDLRGLTWRANPPRDWKAERFQDQRGRPGHHPEAEKADAPLLGPSDRHSDPFAPCLRRTIAGHVAMQTQNVHDHVFGHHRIAARRLYLAKRDLRQLAMLDDVVHAGLTAEHGFQIREGGERVEIRMHEREVFDAPHVARIGPDVDWKLRYLLAERVAPLLRIADTLVQFDDQQSHAASRATLK